jgi:hypothetical protein
MTTAQIELDRSNHAKLGHIWLRLIAAHDLIFSEAKKVALKRVVIALSIAGFAIHLSLIFFSRWLSHPPLLIAGVGRNYLTAISTPFNLILFYEVLTLIAALPASTTRSIGNQFEVVSLIFIRDVFRDIAAASGLVTGHRLTNEVLPVILDMWAALLMFLLVAIFQHVALQRVQPRETRGWSRGLERFITQKKVVTIGLATLLLAMAAYNLVLFLLHTYRVFRTGPTDTLEPTTTFYNDLFTLMIFADVLILILSLIVSGQYEMVFRNAAFVASTILIRFSLTEPHPYGALLALLAMVFGILTLLVFNFHMRIAERTADRVGSSTG